MRRIAALSRFPLRPARLCRIALGLGMILLQGCAVMTSLWSPSWPSPAQPETAIEKNEFPLPAGEDVIGRLAVIRLAGGDTLPDIARHFSLGINALSAANPGVDLWVPEAGRHVTLPLSFILPDAPREGIVVNLATMRLFRFKKDGERPVVSTYPVGVGTKERSTPTGRMYVERKAVRPTWHVPASIAEDHRKKGAPLPAKVPPGPQNPLGEFALYLSQPSYLIHGTNKPASIGLNATNGCLRLYPENIATLYNETPVKTPVVIVDQPYLLGRRNGVYYLEAHRTAADAGAVLWGKIAARLKKIEQQAGRAFDWENIKQVLAEARGIPVPISAAQPGTGNVADRPIEIRHPDRLSGRPEIPELTLDAWYVLAADLQDESEALRLAAIINHQGPPIPARVITGKTGYRVITGPFTDAGEARVAARRLKIDLGIDGLLIEPVKAARTDPAVAGKAPQTERR